MFDDARQRVTETEAVGQVNIQARLAEFFEEVMVAVQNIAKQRLGG